MLPHYFASTSFPAFMQRIVIRQPLCICIYATSPMKTAKRWIQRHFFALFILFVVLCCCCAVALLIVNATQAVVAMCYCLCFCMATFCKMLFVFKDMPHRIWSRVATHFGCINAIVLHKRRVIQCCGTNNSNKIIKIMVV